MRVLKPLLFVLLAFLATPLLAQVAPPPEAGNPYEGRVSVTDQGATSRDQGLREALAQVVSRVSGTGAPATAAGVIARAPQFVTRYGFARDPAGALQLVAAFDKPALDAQLRGLGLAIFGYAAAPAEDLRLRVSGIRDARGYARMMSAVRAVPGVQTLNVESSEADSVDLLIRAEGGRGRIVPALLASRQFADVSASSALPQLQFLP